MDGSALLVVERDADWTRWMETAERLGPPLITLIQEREEPAFEFAARVKARMDRLRRQGAEIRRLTLHGAADWGIPTLRARLEILRKAREASPNVGVELHLDAGHPVRDGLRGAQEVRAKEASRVAAPPEPGSTGRVGAKPVAAST